MFDDFLSKCWNWKYLASKGPHVLFDLDRIILLAKSRRREHRCPN
jgi:hypothetical protein